MKLTTVQFKLFLNNPKLKAALLEFADFSSINLDSLDVLRDSDFRKLKEGIVYVARNYFELIRTYENPPLMQMDPWPIMVYGVSGLYMVDEHWLEENTSTFFSNEDEAINYSNAAYSTFLDVYKTISNNN